jgi:hypothetical protein
MYKAIRTLHKGVKEYWTHFLHFLSDFDRSQYDVNVTQMSGRELRKNRLFAYHNLPRDINLFPSAFPHFRLEKINYFRCDKNKQD